MLVVYLLLLKKYEFVSCEGDATTWDPLFREAPGSKIEQSTTIICNIVLGKAEAYENIVYKRL